MREHFCRRIPGRLRGPEFLLRNSRSGGRSAGIRQDAAVRLATSSFRPGPMVEVTETFLT